MKYEPECDPASDDNLRDGVAYLHGQLHAQRQRRRDEGAAKQERQEYGALGNPLILKVQISSYETLIVGEQRPTKQSLSFETIYTCTE